MTTSIETGTGEGYTAKVNSNGALETTVSNVVAVSPAGPVEVETAAYSVTRSYPTVGVTSATLVNALAGRRSLWVQNQGANPVYLRFAAQAATANDWLVAPGGEFRAEEFRYEGEIRAIATGGNSSVLVLEMS